MSNCQKSDEDLTALEGLDLQDQDDSDSLEGVAVSEEYKLGELLLEGNHANVYSVMSAVDDTHLANLEARAYKLEGIPKKLRKYRLKSIKRLLSRTILEARRDSVTLVVYERERTNSSGITPQDEISLSKEKLQETIKGTILEKKNDRQREAARLRQHETRKLKRQKARQMNGTTDPSGGSPSAEGIQAETDDDEVLYVLLHIAYNKRPELRQHTVLPPASRIVLENYLETQPLKFETALEMEEFAKVKLREVMFFRRQQSKLPDHMKVRKDEFEKILREQGRLPRDSSEYKSMRIEVTIAQHRMTVIRNVQELLPNIISDANKTYRGFKARVNLLKLKRQKIEEIQSMIIKKEGLNRQIVFLERISKEVMPGSEPYTQAVLQLRAAEHELESLEKGDWKDANTILVGLQEEYKVLLASPLDGVDINETATE
jgi:hypothetical protein